MKKLYLYICILLAMILLAGCTVQFKAKEIELDSHVNQTFQLDGFAWTEPRPDLHDPTN